MNHIWKQSTICVNGKPLEVETCENCGTTCLHAPHILPFRIEADPEKDVECMTRKMRHVRENCNEEIVSKVHKS